MHTEAWMMKCIMYLHDCTHHKKGLNLVKKKLPVYSKAEPAKILPTSMWWLSVHTSDVWCRREVLKACITSIFGNILKIDSTKKILKKLSCDAKDSASWVTNVGNE